MKPKVLMVSWNSLTNGGIQAVMMSIIENLYRDYSFDIVIFEEKDYYKQRALDAGCNIYCFKKYQSKSPFTKPFEDYIKSLSYYLQFKKFLKQHKYDIIHCHNYFLAAPILRAAKEAGIPVRIAHSHNVASPIQRKNPLHYILNYIQKKELKHFSTHKVACSKAAGNYLFGNADTTVIPNAINLEKFNPKKYQTQKNESVHFIHVGRYCYQKNQLFLLDVFNEYLKLDKKAKLTMIGFDEWEQKVKNKISQLELENSVTMLHKDSDIPMIMSKSDAMIFPSTYEGLGISLIEAQAMGLKCYVSEAIQPEANLGLCKVLQLSDGAKKWAEIIYKDINQNGYEKHYIDMSSYDITNIIDCYKKLYSSNPTYS